MDAQALNLNARVTGHGRLLFVQFPAAGRDERLAEAIDALGAGLENMHFVDGHPAEGASRRGRLQYLRAAPGFGTERDVADPGISSADALVRLEGLDLEPLLAYERGLRRILEDHGGAVHARAGVQKERSYTSYAMTQFAYAPAQPPRPGRVCPLGVVTPQDKTAEWWAMDWMRREGFFLPRYDERGRIVAKGHALASAAAIPCVTRRLLHNADGYGRNAGWDFIGYFEFAEADTGIFREVMASLRDHQQNPEWRYVREGPEWWGWRVGRADELWPPRT